VKREHNVMYMATLDRCTRGRIRRKTAEPVRGAVYTASVHNAVVRYSTIGKSFKKWLSSQCWQYDIINQEYELTKRSFINQMRYIILATIQLSVVFIPVHCGQLGQQTSPSGLNVGLGMIDRHSCYW